MAKPQEKQKALLLRSSGMSIKSIAEKLAISRGTASLWCQDIILTKAQKKKLYDHMVASGHKGRILGALMNKRKREISVRDAEDRAEQLVGTISKRDLLFLGLGLFWGEGSKKGRGRFIFINSDPFAIKAIMKWLKSVMGIKSELLTPQIYINDQHRYRIKQVEDYWVKTLGISHEQFGNAVFIKTVHKKTYANHDSYMGVLHLAVSRSSALKDETMAMLQIIQQHI